MTEQPDFAPLAKNLHLVAGVITHRSFHRLLRNVRSRFNHSHSAIAHKKMASSLLDRLQSAIPDDAETKLRRTRASEMTAKDWVLLTDLIAGRFRSLADRLTDYKLKAKETTFKVPRSNSFLNEALAVLDYNEQRGHIKTLQYLKSPDGWIYRSESVSYISDALFDIRSFLVAAFVLESDTTYQTFESVLEWAFQQSEEFWQKAYPYDLLVHDFDAIRQVESQSGYIRVCKSHLSTYFSEEPIDSRLWQLGDFVEFRV
ncbi:MAG: hypothetical protein CMF12_08670 [Idiomarina sp.]|uniref:hypothetical protein n=1 Tax=Idiomarina sp. TaxID=1874361 RepID=UPI000C67ADC9|nr:hypothetical protein [Idiomarina sp.]MBT42583.1 hypothetical protein [Idiomarina sp.]